MFETLSSPLTQSAPRPVAPVAKRRPPPPFEPMRRLRPLSGRAFLLFAFIYLYSFPYFDRLRSANEMPRILMTQEIVERHTWKIDARVGEMGSRFDTCKGVGNHIYSNKAPGPSFLAVPVYAVQKLFKVTSLRASTWAFRVFAVTLPALLFLPFFYRLTARFTPEEPARRAALVALALGSSALIYSVMFLSHHLAAICLGGGFVAAVRLARDETPRPKLMALLVGALCATAVLMDYQSLFVAPIVGLYALVRGRARLRNLGLFVLGALPLAVALGVYHKLAFGSPFTTPLSTANEIATKKGFLGLVGPNLQALHVLVLDPSNGMAVLMPWFIFALIGFVAVMASRPARRLAGAEAITCLLVVLIYLGVMSSLVPSFARAGWAVGPRYLGASFPFLAWLAAPGFAAAYRWFVTRSLAQALVLVAVVIFVAAASTFPHWPDGLRNPVHELTFRLVANGYAPYSVGTVLGLKGFWALLPLYVVTLATVLWLLAGGVRWGALSAALACVLAGGMLYAYKKFPPTGAYATHSWGWVTRIYEPPAGPGIPLLVPPKPTVPAATAPPAPPAAKPPAPVAAPAAGAKPAAGGKPAVGAPAAGGKPVAAPAAGGKPVVGTPAAGGKAGAASGGKPVKPIRPPPRRPRREPEVPIP
jgi:hypothetical protein